MHQISLTDTIQLIVSLIAIAVVTPVLVTATISLMVARESQAWASQRAPRSTSKRTLRGAGRP